MIGPLEIEAPVVHKSTKHIEIFPGSISDLEQMTGKRYEAMTDNAQLMKIGSGYYSSRSNVNLALANICRKKGGDAIVHVVYDNISSNNGQIYQGIGYLLKEKVRVANNPGDPRTR